jgi:hypothetical protein
LETLLPRCNEALEESDGDRVRSAVVHSAHLRLQMSSVSGLGSMSMRLSTR